MSSKPRDFIGFIIFLIYLICTIAVLSHVASTESVQVADSVTNVTFDNLMSPDAAAFMATHPGEYTEFDLD